MTEALDLVAIIDKLAEIKELKPEEVFPAVAQYKPTLDHLAVHLDEDKETIKRIVKDRAEIELNRDLDRVSFEQVMLLARKYYGHTSYPYIDYLTHYIINGRMPPLWSPRLKAFLRRARRLGELWERERTGIDFEGLRGIAIEAMNDHLNTIDERCEGQKASMLTLEQDNYFNPDILREVPIPVGVITSTASIETIYQDYYEKPHLFHYVKLGPILVVPFNALANRHFEGNWIVTKGKVKSHGPIPLEIDYSNERSDVVSGRAESSSFGFIVTTNETTLDLRHESRTKTAIYTSEVVEIPLLMERDGVEIPCTYNSYDAPRISEFSPDVRLRLRRNFAEDVPQSQLASPSVLSAFLEGRKGQEVIVGGRMQKGLLRIDTVVGQDLEFRYFAYLDAEINRRYIPKIPFRL